MGALKIVMSKRMKPKWVNEADDGDEGAASAAAKSLDYLDRLNRLQSDRILVSREDGTGSWASEDAVASLTPYQGLMGSEWEICGWSVHVGSESLRAPYRSRGMNACEYFTSFEEAKKAAVARVREVFDGIGHGLAALSRAS
jgi:hypothetical protein